MKDAFVVFWLFIVIIYVLNAKVLALEDIFHQLYIKVSTNVLKTLRTSKIKSFAELVFLFTFGFQTIHSLIKFIDNGLCVKYCCKGRNSNTNKIQSLILRPSQESR